MSVAIFADFKFTVLGGVMRKIISLCAAFIFSFEVYGQDFEIQTREETSYENTKEKPFTLYRGHQNEGGVFLDRAGIEDRLSKVKLYGDALGEKFELTLKSNNKSSSLMLKMNDRIISTSNVKSVLPPAIDLTHLHIDDLYGKGIRLKFNFGGPIKQCVGLGQGEFLSSGYLQLYLDGSFHLSKSEVHEDCSVTSSDLNGKNISNVTSVIVVSKVFIELFKLVVLDGCEKDFVSFEEAVLGSYKWLRNKEQKEFSDFLKYLVQANLGKKKLKKLWDKYGAHSCSVKLDHTEFYEHLLAAINAKEQN